MRIAYLAGEYVSHAKAALGNRRAIERAGYTLTEPEEAELVVVHDEPPAWAEWLTRLPVLRERYLIGYGVWETDRLPSVYRDALPLVQEVWTASQHSARLFTAAGATATVIPHLVERTVPSPAALARMRERLGGTVPFYCISDAGNPRKNLRATLEAFAAVRARAGERARLVVKQYARPVPIEQDGVISIDEPFDEDAMAALHACCSIYVSSHRAEAWGLGISEALAAGNVAIATDWSGNLEFQTAYLVPAQVRALTPEEVAFAPALLTTEMQWAEIDRAALAARMLSCLEGGEPTPRTDVTTKYGLDALADRIRERLSAISEKRSKAQTRPTAELKVGLFHCGGDGDAVIVGRNVAVDGLASALSRHGKRHRYELFGAPRDLRSLEPRLPLDRGRLSLRDRRELAEPGGTFDAWHESQLDGWTPFALRESAAGSWPITLLHHTLSYKELLHTEYLRLLMARPRSYDCIVCSTEPARRALSELLGHVAEQVAASHGAHIAYAGRFEVIPLGVDVERYRPRDRAAARDRFELPQDAQVLLWVGRLSAIDKADLMPLCEVVGELAREHPRLLLVCAGRQRPGERYGGVLQDYATGRGFGDHVRILTAVEGGLELLYAAADVFVSPSDNLQESFGLAPVEAMAAGVPQVAADWDGYKDTVEHGETGLLVPTFWARCTADIEASAMIHDSPFEHLVMAQSVATDMRALRDAIAALLSDEPRRRTMADKSRQRALERFAFPVVVARYEALWAELAAAARSELVPPAPSLGYTLPPYGRAFGHYPTRMLTDSDALRLTERGRALRTSSAELPLHYNRDWRYLDLDLLRRILEGLTAFDKKGEALDLKRLLGVIERRSPGRRDATLRHTLWLLKYGYVELAG